MVFVDIRKYGQGIYIESSFNRGKEKEREE